LTSYTAVKDGLWNDPTTWSPNGVPTLADTVTIPTPYAVTVQGDCYCQHFTTNGPYGRIIFDGQGDTVPARLYLQGAYQSTCNGSGLFAKDTGETGYAYIGTQSTMYTHYIINNSPQFRHGDYWKIEQLHFWELITNGNCTVEILRECAIAENCQFSKPATLELTPGSSLSVQSDSTDYIDFSGNLVADPTSEIKFRTTTSNNIYAHLSNGMVFGNVVLDTTADATKDLKFDAFMVIEGVLSGSMTMDGSTKNRVYCNDLTVLGSGSPSMPNMEIFKIIKDDVIVVEGKRMVV